MGKWARYRHQGTGRLVSGPPPLPLLQSGAIDCTADVAFNNGFSRLGNRFGSSFTGTVERIEATFRRDAAYEPDVRASVWSADLGTGLPDALIVQSDPVGFAEIPTTPIGLSPPVLFPVTPTLLGIGVTYWVVLFAAPAPAASQLFWGMEVGTARLARGNDVISWFVNNDTTLNCWQLFGQPS